MKLLDKRQAAAALNCAGMKGILRLNGWHGVSGTTVEIIGETPKRYRIRAITRTRLAGRGRYLNPGETALVPKYAVEIEAERRRG